MGATHLSSFFNLRCELGAAVRVEKPWQSSGSLRLRRSEGSQRVRQILVLALEASGSGPLALQPQQLIQV